MRRWAAIATGIAAIVGTADNNVAALFSNMLTAKSISRAADATLPVLSHRSNDQTDK
jgi:hypothetical protein